MEKKKMTKAAAIELLKNRKVYVNGKSAEIQEKLFELGFEWENHGKSTLYCYNPFLFTMEDKYITTNDDMIGFVSSKKTEISAEEILAICVVDELKENDVVHCYWKNAVGEYCEWLSVVKCGDKDSFDSKVSYCMGAKGIRHLFGLKFNALRDSQECCRPATEEEKKMLIDALKLSSDGRAKHILKEVFGVEDCPFKPFDKVLVRDGYNEEWKPDLFWKKTDDNNYPYLAISNRGFAQCIPYEGHESLVDTNKKPEE